MKSTMCALEVVNIAMGIKVLTERLSIFKI